MAEEPGPPSRGFQDCFNDLVDRRQRELGSAWDSVNRRSRRAEAARRAREEIARRIEVRGGRRYAASTIARWAARNHWPPGVENFWLERWATIDRAGGLAALARQLGSTVARVKTWRDSKDPSAPPPRPVTPKRPGEPTRIGVVVNGDAWVGTTKIEKKVPWLPDQTYQELTVEADSGILEAWFADNQDELKDLLGPVIADQVISDWHSANFYDVAYTVTEIILFLPNLDD
ncbi:hypothetical protein A5658_12925 [Mycobacterium sp. 1245111.1]|uniref:hypothetical protein n=1 Tax=Mycobacterium sp. 1245111.1 TaxID=1834073 RepID=UPI0007FECEC6|nr:hypothetical protein [Mycobacterium sp. 1245111.1]OBK33746.1 hypothetical protein A5658_12925 [Mycobacterium sp. 1245111.1]